MRISRLLQYAFIAIIVTTVGFSLYQWNQSRASTQKTAPNNGLVGYWSFDEGSGTQAGDASGNGNAGTLTNGPTWTTGKLGQAINFDGADDEVRLGTPSALDLTSTLSISAWIYPRTMGVGGRGRIFDKNSTITGAQGYVFYLNEISVTGGLSFAIGDASTGSRFIVSSANAITLNTWQHVVVTFDASKLVTLYVNNVSVGSLTFANFPTTTTDNAVIGGRTTDDTRQFDGIIDEVRIYNRALSGTEVTNLYNLGAAKLNTSPTSSLTSGLVGYWTFDGKDTPWTSSSAGTATDRSGNGNTGTLTNMSRSTSPVSGILGQALKFDGVDDSVDAPDSALYTQSALSVSFWTKIPKMNVSLNPLVVKTGSGLRSWMINASSAGNIVFTTALNNNEVSTYGTSVGVISENKWGHVVCVFNGSGVANADRMQIYIDGVPQSITFNGTIPATLVDTSAHLFFGENGSNYLPGTIDEVRIYNRALSAGEIQSLYDLGASDKVNSSVSQNQGVGRLDSGLVGYWKLDDASGTTATDSSTNANNGTLTNGPTWGTGKIGGDVVFDGVDDYVNVGNLSIGQTKKFSVGVWFKTSTPSGVLFSEGNNGNDTPYWYIIINGSGNAQFHFRGNSTAAFDIYGSTVVTDGNWHHVVAIDSGTAYLYVDGRAEGGSTPDAAGSLTTNTTSFGALSRTTLSSFFNGSLDEVRIYNRALSDDEVSQLYRLTAPTGVDTSLKGYWSFDGSATNWTSSSAGTVADLSGNGNTGTMTNMNRATSSVSGKLGQALKFTASTNVVTTPLTSTTGFGTGDLSFSAWVKTTGYVNQGSSINTIIARAFPGNGSGYGISFSSTNLPKCQIGTDGVTSGGTALNDNNWHFLMLVRRSNVVECWEDGAKLTDGATTSNIGLTVGIYFGNDNSGGGNRGLAGSLDEVRLYNRALSSTEISALYNSGR